MKSLKLNTLLSLLAICIAFTSCESDEVAPTVSEMSRDVDQNAASGTLVYKFANQIDFSEEDWYFFIGCSEEELRITSGIWRIHYTIVQNKNKATMHYHTNTSNFRAVDETTGETYVGSWVVNDKNRYDFANFYPYQFKQTISLTLATPGKGNNIRVKIDVHLKINADGTIEKDVYNYRADCEQ